MSETSIQRARALAWRDLEGKATKEDLSWLYSSDGAHLWRAAICEIVAQTDRSPLSAQDKRLLATARSRLSVVNARLHEIGRTHRSVSDDGRGFVRAVAGGDLADLADSIEMLSGLDDLKASAVRDRCREVRRKLIELRQRTEKGAV